jgi:hypothetical protein
VGCGSSKHRYQMGFRPSNRFITKNPRMRKSSIFLQIVGVILVFRQGQQPDKQ